MGIGNFVWIPVILIIGILTLVITTNFGFTLEAESRGFHTVLNQINYASQEDSNGCYDNGIHKFCKSDFGFLGIKQWMDVKDQSVWYGLFDKNTEIPQNICKERVVSYDLVKTNSTTTLNVKCNN